MSKMLYHGQVWKEDRSKSSPSSACDYPKDYGALTTTVLCWQELIGPLSVNRLNGQGVKIKI